jgi:hypothetical protein
MVGGGTMQDMQALNSQEIDPNKVDWAILSHETGDSIKQLRKMLGLNPYPSFDEAFGVFASTLKDSREAPLRMDALRDCLLCADSLFDLSLLWELKGLSTAEENEINLVCERFSHELMTRDLSASECAGFYKYVHRNFREAFLTKWRNKAKTKDELLEVYREVPSSKPEVIKELVHFYKVPE